MLWPPAATPERSSPPAACLLSPRLFCRRVSPLPAGALTPSILSQPVHTTRQAGALPPQSCSVLPGRRVACCCCCSSAASMLPLACGLGSSCSTPGRKRLAGFAVKRCCSPLHSTGCCNMQDRGRPVYLKRQLLRSQREAAAVPEDPSVVSFRHLPECRQPRLATAISCCCPLIRRPCCGCTRT